MSVAINTSSYSPSNVPKSNTCIIAANCLCSQSEQNVLQFDILVLMCRLAVRKNYCNIKDVMYFLFYNNHRQSSISYFESCSIIEKYLRVHFYPDQ